MSPVKSPGDRCTDCLPFRQSVDRFIGSAEATNKNLTQFATDIKDSLDKLNDKYAEVDSNISMLGVKVDGVIDDVIEIKKRTSGKGYPAVTQELLDKSKRENEKHWVEDITDRIQLNLLKEEKTKQTSNSMNVSFPRVDKKWYEFIPIVTSLVVLLSILAALGFWLFRGPASMDPDTVQAVKDIIKERKYKKSEKIENFPIFPIQSKKKDANNIGIGK